MIFNKVFVCGGNDVKELKASCIDWLIENIGPEHGGRSGFRPEGIYIKDFWSTIDDWAILGTEFSNLTNNHQSHDSIQGIYGTGWKFILTSCYQRAGYRQAEYQFFIIIDDDMDALQFKLAML
jgi:hypothetical protein